MPEKRALFLVAVVALPLTGCFSSGGLVMPTPELVDPLAANPGVSSAGGTVGPKPVNFVEPLTSGGASPSLALGSEASAPASAAGAEDTPILDRLDRGTATSTGTTPGLSAAEDRKYYLGLLAASQDTVTGVSGKCYKMAVKLADNTGAGGDRHTWPADRSYRGRRLSDGLQEALAAGDLLPGMVVYINNAPGADPDSADLGYQPHWLTYLGRDEAGVARFADQYSNQWSFDDVVEKYTRDAKGKTRKIDTFFDPFGRRGIATA